MLHPEGALHLLRRDGHVDGQIDVFVDLGQDTMRSALVETRWSNQWSD